MRKIMMPVDGSENAQRAVRHAASLVPEIPSLQLCLLNVQEAFEPRVHALLTHDDIHAIQSEQAEQVLAPLRGILDDAGVAYGAEWRVGPVAQTIADRAGQTGCDAIVMGTRGMGAIANLVMGSTAAKVVHLASVPVTLVK